MVVGWLSGQSGLERKIIDPPTVVYCRINPPVIRLPAPVPLTAPGVRQDTAMGSNLGCRGSCKSYKCCKGAHCMFLDEELSN